MSKKIVKQPVVPAHLKINTSVDSEQKKPTAVDEVRSLIECLYLDVKVRSPQEVSSRV